MFKYGRPQLVRPRRVRRFTETPYNCCAAWRATNCSLVQAGSDQYQRDEGIVKLVREEEDKG